jgi:hypothetical protein
VHDRFTRGEVRIGQHFLAGIDPAQRDRMRDHQRLQLVDTQRLVQSIDQVVEFRLPSPARGMGGKARIGRQFRLAHRFGQIGRRSHRHCRRS